MNNKTIAVLMTVHNRKIQTLTCLEKLTTQIMPEGYNYDVWLTDDGCTDCTREAILENYPNVHILEGDGNLYWNRGMRKAWDAAARNKSYDFYLWLNDDTDLYDFAIDEIIKESSKHGDKCNIVGSTQYKDHRGVSYGGYVAGKVVIPLGEAIKVDYFNGNIVLVPDYVYQRVGNLDDHYSHGRGDTDYSYRSMKAGIESWIVGRYLGECDRHQNPKKCWDTRYSIIKRFEYLHHPLGYPPKESFYFDRMHKNMAMAIFHLFTLYIRTLFPQLWSSMGKSRI